MSYVAVVNDVGLVVGDEEMVVGVMVVVVGLEVVVGDEGIVVPCGVVVVEDSEHGIPTLLKALYGTTTDRQCIIVYDPLSVTVRRKTQRN